MRGVAARYPAWGADAGEVLDLDAQMQHPAERLVVEAVERFPPRKPDQRRHCHRRPVRHRIDIDTQAPAVPASVDDLPAVEQRDPVVQRALTLEDAAHQHGRTAVRGRCREPRELGLGARDQRRFQHQILGRIADQLQFWEDDQVAILRLGARLQHRIGIAGHIAHGLPALDKRDDKPVGHGCGIGAGQGSGNSF
mgnify:CR=1 FL=1